MPGPPSRTAGFTGPPTPGMPPGVQRTNTQGSLPPPPNSPPAFAGPPSGPPQYDPQRPSTVPVQQYANYQPNSPGHPPVQSPGQPGYGHSPMPSPGYNPQQPYQPLGSPPPGGFTQYQYGSTTGSTPGADSYGMHQPQHQQHQQLYRPTEQENSIVDNEVAPQRNSNMGKRAETGGEGRREIPKEIGQEILMSGVHVVAIDSIYV